MKRKRATASHYEDDITANPPKAEPKPSPHVASKDDPAFLGLKHALSITPKTTTLLLSSGHTTHQSLADTTPNILLQQFAKHGKMDKKHVEGYRRAARGMVWLGTQPDPTIFPKSCHVYTIKNLTAKGIWVENWDDLTGKEVNDRFGDILIQECGA